MKLVAVNYHYVRPAFDLPHPGIQGMTTTQFEQQLRQLGKMGEFVSVAQIRNALNGAALPERAILITFDDGLYEQHEHAWPILQRLGIPAVFFVSTAPIVEAKVLTVHKIHLLRSHVLPAEFLTMIQNLAKKRSIDLGARVDASQAALQYCYDTPEVASLKHLLNFQLSPESREELMAVCFAEVFPGREADISRQFYMTVPQIQELGRSQSIGSHSHEHYLLGLLPAKLATEQIALASSHLEKWMGWRPFAISYPYGLQDSSSLQTQQIASGFGLELGFTMERARNDNLKLPLALGRFDANDVPGGKSCRFPAESFFEMAPVTGWFRS